MPVVDFLVTCLKEANPNQLLSSKVVLVTVET
jgi:hypothetical protein